MLTTFQAIESEQSEILLKYAKRIATDFGMPYESDADLAALSAFHKKQSLPKQGRWFSWSQACEEENLTEYWPSRMIYDHHLGRASLSQDIFAIKYRSLRRAALSRHHYRQECKMWPRWIELVGRRIWKPSTEEGCHFSQDACRWLLNRPQGEKLEQGLFSKLVFPFVVICSAGLAYASLGNAAWAVAAWSLISVAGGHAFQPAAAVLWLHVTDPSQWQVNVVEDAIRPLMGIIMSQVRQALPLIRYFVLPHPDSIKFTFQDNGRIAVHLGVLMLRRRRLSHVTNS